MIMLIGLVTKNGILIVEFANQNRLKGMKRTEAAIYAATQRLRPILMTSLAMSLGALPLALSLGACCYQPYSVGYCDCRWYYVFTDSYTYLLFRPCIPIFLPQRRRSELDNLVPAQRLNMKKLQSLYKTANMRMMKKFLLPALLFTGYFSSAQKI